MSSKPTLRNRYYVTDSDSSGDEFYHHKIEELRGLRSMEIRGTPFQVVDGAWKNSSRKRKIALLFIVIMAIGLIFVYMWQYSCNFDDIF